MMLPPDDWDDPEPAPTIEGENLYYARKHRCPISAPSARSHFPPTTSASISGPSLPARIAAKWIGWVADQITHLEWDIRNSPTLTATDRTKANLYRHIAKPLDCLALWLLRSR